MKFKYCIVLFCCFCLIACTDADDAAVADHPAYHNPTVQQLTDAIAENPNDAALYYKRSIALSRINQDSLSLIDLLKATSIDSTKPEYYQAIGFVQINLGNYAAATTAFERNLQFDPGNATYMLLIAKSLLEEKKTAAAQEWVTKAMNARPNYLEAEFMHAQIKAAEHDTLTAIKLTQSILQRNPAYYDASLQLADWYKGLNDNQAIVQYQKTFALDTTDATPLYEIARFYEQQGKLNEAKQAFRRCVISDPDYSYGYIHYADILMKQDSHEKALRQYELAIATDPANADAWYGKGLSLEHQEKKDSARYSFQQALTLDPDLQVAKDALLRLKQEPH
jgi:tetratricopeptide (TPR) repeat protein